MTNNSGLKYYNQQIPSIILSSSQLARYHHSLSGLLLNYFHVVCDISVFSWNKTVLVFSLLLTSAWPLNLQLSYGSWIYNYLCNQCLSPKVVRSNPTHGEVYSIQHYVIKFVNDFRQVGGFLLVLWFPPPIKLSATI